MSQHELPRRIALRTLLLGAAGVAVAGCGGSEQPASGSASPPAGPATAPLPGAAPAPAPAAPVAAPAGGGGVVDPREPQAQSLGYVIDAGQVDPATNPMYQPGQLCSNCVQYQGPPDAMTAPCTIFAGRIVAGPGWCKVWAKKPA